MSWHFLERWLEKTNEHSTLVGKIWITLLIVCRMVIVPSVGMYELEISILFTSLKKRFNHVLFHCIYC